MHANAVSKAHAQIDDAVAHGARRITGEAAAAGPLFVTPTLLVDVPDAP